MQLRQALRRGWSYLTLAGILLATYGAMALRGFNLGLYSDILAYIWHYETRGIRGGMNWLVVEHWERHLAGALASAPIQVLFPGNDDAWYAIALLIHFTNAFLLYFFFNYWQRRKHRILFFVAVLLFAFNALQVRPHIEFATGTHTKIALTLSIISLWAYIHYVRTHRQYLVLYNLSWFCFALAGAIYEQALFFFLLHPFLAALGEWGKPITAVRWRYGLRLILDMVPFGLFVVGYVYLLDVLFISSNSQPSPEYVVRQIWTGFNMALNPLAILEQSQLGWQGEWSLVAVGISSLAAFGLWYWWQKIETQVTDWWQIIVLGASVIILNLLNVAPTDFAISSAPRLIYVSAIGTGLIYAVLSSLIAVKIQSQKIGGVVFAFVPALMIGSGAAHFFQLQSFYLQRDNAREAVKAAIYEALPEWDEETPPYFIIITDVHPFDDLALYAQDIGFPYMFDLLYDTEGILADAVYTDITAPPQTSGQHIIATEDGIISPIRQDLRIDPARLVVVSYDSATQSAQILDAVPPDVLAAGNFYEEVPFDWQTNRDYLTN